MGKKKIQCRICPKVVHSKNLCRKHYSLSRRKNVICSQCEETVFISGLCQSCYRTKILKTMALKCSKCPRRINTGKYCSAHIPASEKKHPEQNISEVDVDIENNK